MKWKDRTSYSYSDKDRTARTWELRTSKFIITVTRHIDLPPDQWQVTTSLGLEVPKRVLKNKDIDKAKQEAVDYVRKYILECLESVQHL